MESPPNNDEPYVVQFADGTTAKAYFHELTLRRKEVEMELGEVADDLLPFIIYRCQVGSKAFGLAGEDADDDLRGIYLPPARLHWSLYRLPEQLGIATDTHDEVYWELEKFLLLALKANPNVLETLWTPLVLLRDAAGRGAAAACGGVSVAAPLQDVFGLRPQPVPPDGRRGHKTQGTFKPKHAMHLIRLLHSAASTPCGPAKS